MCLPVLWVGALAVPLLRGASRDALPVTVLVSCSCELLDPDGSGDGCWTPQAEVAQKLWLPSQEEDALKRNKNHSTVRETMEEVESRCLDFGSKETFGTTEC